MLVELSFFLLGTVTFPSLFKLFSGYVLTIKDDVKRFEISARIVSAIQAMMAVAAGLVAMHYTSDDILLSRFMLVDYYMCFAIPYFYYDTWAMYKTYLADENNVKDKYTFWSRLKAFLKSEPMLMVHHVLLPAIYGPVILFFRNGKGDYLIACTLLMETTIPFISTRYILYQLGMRHTTVYIVNGILLAITFGLFRLVIWVYLVHCYAVYRQVSLYAAFFLLPNICKYCTSGLFAMNLYWFIYILFIVKRSVNEIFAKNMRDS